MEQNPSELEVPVVVEEQPKRARKRIPKKALEQIERATRANEEARIEEDARKEVPAVKPRFAALQCECGAYILSDKDGMYPERCPECGTWNDYRGVKYLEASDNILVCDKCGGLTLITPETTCCQHCGAR